MADIGGCLCQGYSNNIIIIKSVISVIVTQNWNGFSQVFRCDVQMQIALLVKYVKHLFSAHIVAFCEAAIV